METLRPAQLDARGSRDRSGLRREWNATTGLAIGPHRAKARRHRTRSARDLTLRTARRELRQRTADGRAREADLAGEARVETLGVLRARRAAGRVRQRIRRASDPFADEHRPLDTREVDLAAPEAIA